MAGKSDVLALYKLLIRESKKFTTYNFRMYALRRIRDSFQENKNLTDSRIIDSKMEHGMKNLDIIRKQVIIGHMFSTDKLVIENNSK